MKVIIYKQDNGSVAVVHPNKTTVDKYGIDALAKKDVPTGCLLYTSDAADEE